MTPKGAHYWLEEKQRMMTQYRHLFSSEDVEVNGMAILAIEKQIPKKQNGIFCPVCNFPSIKDRVYGDRYPYCYNCGQAIDREDSE